MNIRDRRPGESDEQHERRLRRQLNAYRAGPARTVAQDKRDALKARNRKRSKA